MRSRITQIGIVGVVLLTVLAGCGGGSDPTPTTTLVTTENVAPTATIVVTENVAPTATTVATTNNVEPTGEAPGDVVISTNPLLPPAPTSTLYAVDQPTPTVLTAAQCSYGNSARLDFLDFEEHRAELHACNELVQWPAGYEIDVEKLAYYGGNNYTGGEVGVARTGITLINACAWVTYWSDSMQAGDQAAADEALAYLGDTLMYFRLEGPPGPGTADPLLEEIVSTAQLGDPSGLQSILTYDDCLIYNDVRVKP